jgi:GntR family carbon starvation induced transcriptional regulator
MADLDKELSLVLQGHRAVRSRIVRGEYLPGMRLRIESLQQSLAVSSSPLREALNRLVAEGLVEVDEGRGFRVAQISVPALKELTYLRILLEGDALRRSVAAGDMEWEGRVVSALHKLRRSEENFIEGEVPKPEDFEEWSERHRQFHLALLSGCGFPRLLQMCETLYDQAERYRRVARLSRQPRKKAQEHKKLADAALGRNVEKAVEILHAHIQKTADRVVEVLDGDVEQPSEETME